MNPSVRRSRVSNTFCIDVNRELAWPASIDSEKNKNTLRNKTKSKQKSKAKQLATTVDQLLLLVQ